MVRNAGYSLHNITPGLARNFTQLIEGAASTKNPMIDARRPLFDALVQLDAVSANSFASARGQTNSVTEGKTEEILIGPTRKRFYAIDVSTPMSLCDRFTLGVIADTSAHVGTVAELNLVDYRNMRTQRTLRFRDKGGKNRDIPVCRDLEGWINKHIAAAAIAEGARTVSVSSVTDRTERLTKDDHGAHSRPRHQIGKRRLKAVGLPESLSPHSCHVTLLAVWGYTTRLLLRLLAPPITRQDPRAREWDAPPDKQSAVAQLHPAKPHAAGNSILFNSDCTTRSKIQECKKQTDLPV